MKYDPNNILNCEETNFVKLSVYQSLEAENARLKAEVERLDGKLQNLNVFYDEALDKNDDLKAQVERLTKAGDELWEFAKLADTNAPIERRKALKDWNDAKEGKQP